MLTHHAPLDSRVIRFAIGMLVGVAAVQRLESLPGLGGWLFLAFFGLLLLTRRAIWLPAIILGATWAGGHARLELDDALSPQPGRVEAWVEGQILDIADPMDRGERFDFGVERVLEPSGVRIPAKVRVSWYDGMWPVRAGDRWRLRLSLRPPRGMLNPGTFDYEEWLFANGIRAVGYVRNDPDNQPINGPMTAGAMLRQWRQTTQDRLDAVWSGSPMRGLLKALTMGAEQDISRSQWEVLRRTGTAHLIAISGSHIGLVAGLVFFLTRRLAARLGSQRVAPPTLGAVAGFLAALVYAALAGFSIPTQRAVIMIAVAMLAIVWQRQTRTAQLLALALIAVLLWDPMAVLAPGFWLSFGAVALIAYAVSGRLGTPGRWRLLWRINAVTALGLAPLLLVLFRQVSLVSPVANLLAVPVLGTLLIPVCLLGTVLLWVVPTAGEFVLHGADVILRESWRVLEWFSALPFAQWTRADLPPWTWVPALLGVLLLLAPRGVPGRWLGVVLWLPALLHQPERPEPGGYRLTLLDVGQGLSAVIETRHRTLIFDTGARLSDSFDMGSAVVEPYLRHRGLSRIDALVVSHGDDDHIGGARSLLAAFPVGQILTSVPQRLAGAVTPTACRVGQSWQWDGVGFDLLGPITPTEKDNDNSCVLRVSGAGGSVLLTGDVEAGAEHELVAMHGEDLKSDVLIVPHHGSRTSSTPGFLDWVQPRLALIPAGHLNRFGFPHPDVVRRYRERRIGVMTAGETGAITLDADPRTGLADPVAYRQVYRRFWSVP